MQNYIVTNKDGLLVRAQMSTKNDANIKRKMSLGEGFVGYQTYVQNGNETWVRVSNNPGDVQQEYACVSIGNRSFAKLEVGSETIPAVSLAEWAHNVDAWLRVQGYKGPKPE